METSSYPSTLDNPHIRNIVLDLVLTVLTFGLYNFWVQHKQMKAVNTMLKEDKYSFWMWLFLFIITFGIYHIYHEYRKSHDIAVVLKQPNDNEPIINVILTCLGFFFVADAIQQTKINKYFGAENAL